MKNIFFIILINIPIVLCCSLSAAEVTPSTATIVEKDTHSPYEVIKVTGEKLFNRIVENQQELVKFPDLMNTIIEDELLPILDYKYIAYKVLGKHLKKSTKKQRENFVDALRSNIIRSYAIILRRYNGQNIIYEAIKPIQNKRLVSVTISIVEQGKPAINLLFKLRRQKRSGKWLIFDVLAEGISMLSSKQAEISGLIRKYGLDQVTKEIKYVRNKG